ncbi:MAG: c-type cytochrome [Candidatus Cyclobacteriaceae bacterium M3_2C_046]
MRLIIPVLIFFHFYSCGSNNSESQAERGPASTPQIQSQSQPQEAVHPGLDIYNKYCIVCHQSDGNGVPGLYPPITETEMVNGDKTELINIILNGMSGPVEVKGEPYNNIMPAQDFLSDQEIADVLTYIRSNFGNNSAAVTAQEVAQVRNQAG